MKRYADTFFRYWPLVLLPILILPLAALVLARGTPKTTVTTADIWVSQSVVSQMDGYNQWNTAAQNEAGALSQLLQTGMFDSSVINGSPAYRQRIATSKNADAYKQAVTDVSTNLQILPRGNNLISVSYSTKDPALGVDVVNSFITNALNQAQALNQQTNVTMRATYNSQAHAARQQLYNDTITLHRYMNRVNLHLNDVQAAQVGDPTLATLVLQVQNDEKTVTDLQQKINDAQIQMSATPQSVFKVVDGAGTVVTSNKKQILLDSALGLVVGLVLGGGFLVGRTLLDRSLRFADDAAELLAFPTLTVIPHKPALTSRQGVAQPTGRRALPPARSVGNAR